MAIPAQAFASKDCSRENRLILLNSAAESSWQLVFCPNIDAEPMRKLAAFPSGVTGSPGGAGEGARSSDRL